MLTFKRNNVVHGMDHHFKKSVKLVSSICSVVRAQDGLDVIHAPGMRWHSSRIKSLSAGCGGPGLQS